MAKSRLLALVPVGKVVAAKPFNIVSEPNNPLTQYSQLHSILQAVLNLVFYVGISLTIIFLLIGGVRYIMAGGDKAGVEAARSNITAAIIGFVVVIGAFAINVILKNVLGAAGEIPVTPTF